MEIPLFYFLLPLAAFGVIAVIFLFVNLFHIAQYGLQSGKTAMVLFGYALLFFVAAALCVTLLMRHEWTQSIPLQDIFTPLGTEQQSL